MSSLQSYKQKWFNFMGYVPHEGQMELHYPPEGEYDSRLNPDGVRFSILACGRRFGKSYACAKEIEVVLTQPNKIVWNVAPTYDTASRIFNFVYEDLVIKKGYKPSKYSSSEQILEFDWDGGKSIFCGKSAEFPVSFTGQSVDLLIMDECAKIKNLKKIWEMYLRPTLSDRKVRMIAISTPDGFGYFYSLFLSGKKTKHWFSMNIPSWKNKFAFPLGQDDPDLIEARETLSKEIFQQEYASNFVALAGKVFEDFGRETNVGEYPFDPNLPVLISIDWGFRMPCVLFFQVKRIMDEKTYTELPYVYIIDEICHLRNVNTKQLFQKIKEKGYRFARAYGDPAGYQVQSSYGEADAHMFEKEFGKKIFRLRDKVSRKISNGISHMRSFILNETGQRRLLIDENCHGVIQDFESYRYPEDRENYSLNENPVKDGVHDHAIDSARFFFVSHFPIRNQQIGIHKV